MTVRRRHFNRVQVEAPKFKMADLARPPEWTVESPCASTDPEIFHPDHGGSGPRTAAKRMCWDVCPVREQCLEWALEFEAGDSNKTSQAFGIYGGFSASERKKMLRERRASARESA